MESFYSAREHSNFLNIDSAKGTVSVTRAKHLLSDHCELSHWTYNTRYKMVLPNYGSHDLFEWIFMLVYQYNFFGYIYVVLLFVSGGNHPPKKKSYWQTLFLGLLFLGLIILYHSNISYQGFLPVHFLYQAVTMLPSTIFYIITVLQVATKRCITQFKPHIFQNTHTAKHSSHITHIIMDQQDCDHGLIPRPPHSFSLLTFFMQLKWHRSWNDATLTSGVP